MDQTIVVTGASSGIGKATAKLFARNGWHVIAASRKAEHDAELRGLPNVRPVALDVTDPAKIREAVAAIVAETPVDVVFNNAGTMLLGPLEGTTDEQMVAQIATNLFGPIRVTQAFVPHFRERGRGLFINTTSLNAIIPGPFMTIYTASKAGLERWSYNLNMELNPLGIRVKTIIPGIAKTDIFNHATVARSAPYEAAVDKMLATLGHPPVAVEPEEIAAVVFTAATDGADQIRYLADGFAKDSVARIVGLGEQQVQTAGAAAMFT